MSGSINKKEIIVDTNVLVYSVKQGIDIKFEIGKIPEISEIIILECVKNELFGLSRKNMYALLALKESRMLRNELSDGSGDNCIMRYAIEKKCAILTNDRKLILEAKKNDIAVFTISDGRKIKYA
ncbi:MAG: type II toxin-antitoxin system VapC family toxin [Thermoplasmataceae archaeon]